MGVQRFSDLVTNSDFSHFNSFKKNKSLSDFSDYKPITKRNRNQYNEQLARNKAQYLADKLKNPSRLLFYLKCSWNLTDNYLDRLLTISLNKDDPIKYFSASASREMIKNG